MKNFLKQILYFLRRNYPKLKLIICILVALVFLINIFVSYQTTNNEKANIDQKIFEREQITITRYNKEVEQYEKDLEEYKKYKKSPEEYEKSKGRKVWGFELFQVEPKGLESQLLWDSELQKLKEIKNKSFNALWLEHFLSRILPLFVLAFFVMATFGIISVFLETKKRLYRRLQIQKMSTFQKCCIYLLFGILIILILILLSQ